MLNAMPSASANITRTRQIGIRQLSLSGRCRLGRATELVFVLATGAVLTIGSQAQGQTWDGGGANASWGTAENWDTDSVPNVWGIFTIDGAGGSKQPVVDTNQSATFTQVLAGTLTVNATLTSPVTVAGTGVLTINTGHQVIGIVSANGPNAVVNNNGTVTGVLQLSNGTVNNAGAVAGGTSLYGGTLNLNAGSNLSDTQALTINVGTVNVNVTDTVGSLSLRGGTVTGLGTLTVNGAMAMSGGNIASGATVNAGGAKTLTGGTIVGTLGGAGSTTITGTVNLAGGTLTGGPVTVGAGGTLNTAGVVNAATTVSGGTLNMNGGSNLSDTQALTVDGGTVNVNTIDTVGSLSGTGGTINFSPGGRLTVNQAVDGSFAGGMSGNDAFATSYFEKHGAGTLTLTGTSTVAGVGFVQILDGMLRVSGGNAISNTTVVLIGDATLELLSDETIGALWTTSGATVNLNANTLTIGGIGGLGTVAPFGVITGTGSLVYTAADLTSLFSGAFTYTGDTTISAGTFVVGVNDLIADASDVFVTGGTLDMQANSDTVASLSLQGGSITGNGGTLNVNGAMAMSGGTIASGATVNAGGARTLSGGTIAGTLGGAGAATITGTVNLAGGTLTGGPVTVAAGGTLNTSGVVTAAMTVSGGTLNLNGGSNLSDTQALTVDGGTVNVNTIDTVGSLSGTGGTINFGADNISTDVQLIVDQAVDGTYAGGMSGNTSFNATYFLKRGGGTLTLSGTSAVTGPGRFQITNGTLQVSGGNAIGNRSIVRIGNATLELLSDETIGALNSPAGSTINLNGNTLTLAGLGGSTNVGNGSLITGSGNFVHAAPGMTSTFGTAFTYTGDTTISAGTFRLGVNDLISDASDVFVTGGTLDLNGNSDTVASLSLQSGRVTGTGTLTVNGAMTMSGGNLDANTTVNAAGQKTLTGGTITGTLGGAGSATITGTVNLANGGTLTGGPVTVGAGGTLSISLLGNVTSILSLTGGGVVSATTDITLTSSPINVANGGTFTAAAGRTLTLQTTGFSRSRDSTTVFGTAGVDGTVVLNATGVVGIDQNSVFRVAGGTLRLGTGALVNFLTSGIAEMENIVDAGATLDMNGRDRRIERLSGAGTVTNSGTSAITLDLSNRLVATNFAGVIRDGTGAVGLTKTGAETLTLTGNNIYTGTTTISGGTLQVGNGGITGSLGAGNIVNNAALVFNRSDDITVGNTISGNGSLTQAGTGMLTVAGTNSSLGPTIVNAGILNVTGSIAGDVTVASGALRIGHSNAIGGSITTTGSRVVYADGVDEASPLIIASNTTQLEVAGTDRATQSGQISANTGFGGFEKIGTGSLTLSGANTYAGITTVSAGTLTVTNGAALGAVGAGNGTVVANGATLALSGGISTNEALTLNGTGVSDGGALRNVSGNNTVSGAITLDGATRINADAGQLFLDGVTGTNTHLTLGGAGLLSTGNINLGTGTLTKDGSGGVAIAGTGTFASVTVAGGLLQLNNGAAIADTALVTLDQGTELVVVNSETIGNLAGTGTVSILEEQTLTVDTGTAGTFGGVIQGNNGGLTKLGAETLTLTGNNTYTGTTTISGGTLQVGNGGATGSLGTGNIVNNAALVFDRSDDITVGNAISGSGTLTKQGAGRLTLSGANTYSGATHIDAGVLLLTGANLGNGAGAVTVAAGAALELAFAATPVNPMTISGAGSGAGAVVGVGANSSLDGTITLAADAAIGVTGSNILNIGGNVVLGANTLTLSGAGTRFVTGNISGTGGLTHAEGMTLFSGTGTYLGPTTLTGGTMVIRGGTAIQDQGAVIVNAGTLRVNLSETLGSIAGAGAIQIDTSQTLTTGGNNATTSVSGVITGAGGLTKQGSGTLTLTGNNSYTGATTITGGTLSLGNMGGTGALAAASDITINSAGTLELARNDSVTIANTISGAGRIAVSGGGTTILSGASTGFAGALDVTNGTARVTGSLGTGATVTVGATGILQGTGTIGGNVTVQDGGTLAAGASPGVLTVAGDLVLSSGSISAFELGAANITGSTLNDLVIVTGNLTLDGLLNLVADPLADGYYRLFSYGGNLTDNGLMLGVLPIGTTATVLTNVAGEVNLRVGVATGALFWDGGVANASNGTINGGTGTWNATEANWTIANGSFNDGWTGGDAIFGGTAGTVTVAGTQAVADIAFTTSGYTLTAGALNLASATSRIDVLAGGTANINTALSGSSDLQKTGGGTLILGGDNSYAGTTMISTGTLTITHGNALGGTAAGTVVADGATLALSGAILTAEEITLHGTGVANGGALRNLDRDNIMTGQITLGSAARINSDAGALSIRGGITGMNTDLTIGGADVTLITGNITTGTGGLTKDGSGTVLLAGVNTFTGALNLVAGDMQVDGGQAIADSVAVTLASGTSLRVRGNETVGSIAGAGNIAIIDTHTLTTGGNDGATTFSGVISGATGSLTKAGTGRLTLTGTNTYTGTTTISGGTLQVGNGGTTGSLGTGNIVNNAALVFDRSDDITLGNAISGSGTLTQAGAGRLTLTGTHTHTGGTTIAAGVLRVAATGALGSGTVTVTSGTVLELATDGTFANAMTVAGNGNGAIELIAPGSNASLNGVITLAGDSTINAGAGTLNVGGTITGAGHALSFGGAGTTIVTGAITTDAGSVTNTAGDLSLQGTNSYTGDTVLQGGRLLIAGGNAISDMGAVILNAGRLVVEDSETVGAISGAGDVTIHEGQALTAGGNNATTTLSGVISGAGGLTKQGSGKLTLTATHTYTGATTVEAGQLDVTGAIASALVTINGGSLRVAGTSLSDTATVTLAGTGTLSLTGSETFGRLTSATGAGLVTLGSHSLTLTGGADALFGGSIGGTGGVSITGGTHVWSGAHGYTGTTTISAGVLRLGANDVLADLSGLVISGGQFDIAGFNDILGTLAMSAGSITGTGRMTARSAHLTGGTLATTLEATETEVSSGRVVVTGSIEGAVTLGTGAILELGSDSAVTGPITASADGTEIIYGDGLDLGAALILGAGTTQLTVASTDAATQSGAISGSGAFGIDKAGSGTLILTGTNSYAGTTTISGGILQVGNGGATGSLGAGAVTNDGALVIDWSNSLSVANAISGTGGLTQAGTGTLTLTGPNSFTGDTLVNAGSLVLGGGAAIHDAGVITVAYGAVLELRESETIGQLVNRGRVTLSGATPVAGTVLTVAGDYSANSELELDVVLGGDGSASDRLVVMGATSGTTNVIIRNQGGTGASTRAGIMLVEVQGASEGSFVLANGDVVLPDGERGLKVGNHVYVLRDVAGNWLLQSRLAGGLEVFQALPGAMQGLVRADSMGQRTAGRITGAGAPAASGAITMSSQGQPAPMGGAWVSLGGGRFDVSPQGTESGLSYSQSTQRIAAGFDMPLYQGASGRWVGGIGLFSGNSDVSATSDNGGGTIASKATGVSLTASWPGDGGFYADLQFALARLSADITTADGDRLASGLGGRARMASVEIGQSVHLQDGLVLTSQAQLSWSEIRIDSFTAAGGAAVQVGQTDGLALRLGLAAEQTWATDAGPQARVYGIANITHELEGDSNVLVDGTAMTAKAPDWTAEFGLGGSLDLPGANRGQTKLYGEITGTQALSGGSMTGLSGSLGVRVTW